jgi:hypothetical protein
MKIHFARVMLLALPVALNMQASLIFTDVITAQGGGFGNFTNILTVQNNNNEAGCVAGGPGGTTVTGDCNVQGGTFTGGNEVGPTNTNFTNLIAFGGTGAENIQIGFNGAEPGNARDLTITELRLTLYANDGTALYSTSGFSCQAGLPGCTTNGNGTVTIDTQPGQGNFGYVFQLSPDQATALNGAGAGRLGLATYITDSFGSQETFFLVNGSGGGGNEIPEPSTWMLLLGGGMAIVGSKFRRVN